jgi:hypothetical protein
MKKLLLYGLSVFAVNTIFAQGILNNGAFIVMTGSSQIVIVGGTNGDYLSQANGRITPSTNTGILLEGDWTNNAGNTGFTADAGSVTMNGANQSINGSSSTTFFDLKLQNAGTKTLNVNTATGGIVTTTGILSVARPLDLNSFRLTVNNPAAAGITVGIGGYIISETNVAGNPSIVRWVIGTNTGARVVPFGTTAGVLIPLTVNTTGAMAAGTDFFQVATRPTAASNNLPWSTSVTHMFDPTLAQDGADEAVVDRWWDFTWNAAATATLTYNYRGAENTMIVPYNTGNIGAQYWAGGWLPNNSNIGSAVAVTVGVGTVTAAGVAFAAGTFTPMVLSSLAAPLPIELNYFKAVCNNGNAQISWETASEMNNDYFTIERSEDGISFRSVGTVNAAGTSSIAHQYSFVDAEAITSTTYYRLRQTDFNGQSTVHSLQTVEPCDGASDYISAFASGAQVNVLMNLHNEGNYVIHITDARGRLIESRQVTASIGANRFEMGTVPATGIYFITVTGASNSYSNKVYITRD